MSEQPEEESTAKIIWDIFWMLACIAAMFEFIHSVGMASKAWMDWDDHEAIKHSGIAVVCLFTIIQSDYVLRKKYK